MNPSIIGFLRKYEPLLFLLVLIGLLTENFIGQWVVTLDGPAHLYNSVVARDLISNPASDFAPYFQINTNPVPNSLDHSILILLGTFLPLSIADLILHLLITAGICFAFRFLVLQINREQVFASWLIFPFCQTAIFFLGFYNFELGIALCLLITGIWLKTENQPVRFSTVLLLLMLSTLLYFTHLIPFLLMAYITGLRQLILLFRKQYKPFLQRGSFLLISLIPALILLIIYFSNRSEMQVDPSWPDFSKSLHRLFTLQHLFVLNVKSEETARRTALILFIAMLYSVFIFFRQRKTGAAATVNRYGFWFALWLFFLVLIFLAPDDFGGMGLMTDRLIEISWILLLLALASSFISQLKMMLIGLTCAFLGLYLSSFHYESISDANRQVNKLMKLAPEIAPYRTGVYIPFSDKTIDGHFGELLFAEKNLILLSDYEAVHDYFIVKWNPAFKAQYSIGGLKPSDLGWIAGKWPDAPGKKEKNIDYVLLCKKQVNDTIVFNRLQEVLNVHYRIKKTEMPFVLYESKTIGKQ